MKKIIFTLMLLSIIPATVLAWDDCPQGEVFCEGKCGLFIDTDNDGICDRSQSAPEDRNSGTTNNQATEEEIHDLISGKDLKTKTINEVAEIYLINVNEYTKKLSEYLEYNINPNDSFQLLHDNYGLEPSMAKEIAISIKSGTQINLLETNEKQHKKTYHFLLISICSKLTGSINRLLSTSLYKNCMVFLVSRIS